MSHDLILTIGQSEYEVIIYSFTDKNEAIDLRFL